MGTRSTATHASSCSRGISLSEVCCLPSRVERGAPPALNAVKRLLASRALIWLSTSRGHVIMRRTTCSLLLLASVAGYSSNADATPAQIIITRHGEKQDAYRLCDVGVQRSQALAGQYLGKGAKNSLFTGGRAPDAYPRDHVALARAHQSRSAELGQAGGALLRATDPRRFARAIRRGPEPANARGGARRDDQSAMGGQDDRDVLGASTTSPTTRSKSNSPARRSRCGNCSISI